MLIRLDIRNVVLIESLSLEGAAGLVALTGETGAGKSILLDALGLCLGARAEAGLVRHGAEQASVTACFDVPDSHPARALLRDKDIAIDDTLIFRRTVGRDGRSKAFINDAPVSVQTLREAGALLAEIHGQFETQGLLDPATHRDTLDVAAGLTTAAAALASLWDDWKAARTKLEEAEAGIENMKLQEEYLRYTVAELEKLAPQPGEESALAEKRQQLMLREKMADAFTLAGTLIEDDGGIQPLMGRLQVVLERLSAQANAAMVPLLEALSRAQAEVGDIAWRIEKIKSGGHGGSDSLQDVEDRYFALRDCAKKHRCAGDDLPQVLADLSQKLRLITHRDDALDELKAAADKALQIYRKAAADISARRQKQAGKLAASVQDKLPALKLDKAVFSIACTPMADPQDWGPHGMDRVQFMVATNPQTPPGPLHKIASGGELSRFMLALKVVLAETGSVPTLIFDEVDSGIGGATADAVGEQLQALAKRYQVLVVTHSPQVAARARHHWHVAKSAEKGKKGAVFTQITPLSDIAARQEEIARMLSGAEVTREARAQAARLLEKHDTAA